METTTTTTTSTTTTISTSTTLIKHIVLSGGGPSGLLTYGAIRHLAKEGFWQLKNIKSIYKIWFKGIDKI